MLLFKFKNFYICLLKALFDQVFTINCSKSRSDNLILFNYGYILLKV